MSRTRHTSIPSLGGRIVQTATIPRRYRIIEVEAPGRDSGIA